MRLSTLISRPFVWLREKITDKVCCGIFVGLVVGGPASVGAAAGAGLGFTGASIEILANLKPYANFSEAFAAAHSLTTDSMLVTGAIGGIIAARRALQHPWANAITRDLVGLRPAVQG
jgi:hypothetical protein